MKLKYVVATMSILGFINLPTLAATADSTVTTSKTTTTDHAISNTPPKLLRTQTPPPKYKPVNPQWQMNQLNKNVMVCTMSQNTIIMDEINQNTNRALPSPCMNDLWTRFIQISGGINIDVGKFGSRNVNFMGENYQRVSLNDVYINIAADINEWFKAFASISYGNPTTQADDMGAYPAEYSAAYSNNIQGNRVNNVQLEQAYATFANFDKTPIFIQLGKQFQDFSRYQIHPITRTMTQVISETLATSAKIGFVVPMGLHGSIFVFDDPTGKIGKTPPTTNAGVSLGYDWIDDRIGYDLGAAFLYNLYGVNDIAYLVNNFTGNTNYSKTVGGLAAYIDLNVGPFGFGFRYTTALRRFAVTDMPQFGLAPSSSGAKPWALDVLVDFTFYPMFDWWYKRQNIFIGFQTSREAAGLRLPRNRWLAGYNIDVLTNTNIGIEWDHDQAYSLGTGGTGSSTDLVSFRAAVKFG